MMEGFDGLDGILLCGHVAWNWILNRIRNVFGQCTVVIYGTSPAMIICTTICDCTFTRVDLFHSSHMTFGDGEYLIIQRKLRLLRVLTNFFLNTLIIATTALYKAI